MLPVCYPSSPSSTTGLPEAVAYALSSVSGLTRWVDYIPIKLVSGQIGANENTTNNNGGFVAMRLLGSSTGLNAWRDYIPVYVDNSATEAWVTSATGYIPYANSVGSGVGMPVSMVASRVTGIAPLAVFFDASATTSVLTTKPTHDVSYKWGFGDPSSGTWSVGARAGVASKNEDYGPVAAHLFETPGTYTVTLQATDGVNTSSRTVDITVLDPDIEFASNTVCFSTSGDFTGCPVGATQVTQSNFKTAIETYQATKKRLLFRAGETFTSTTQAIVSTAGPGYVGKYGSGAAPKFTTTSTNTFLGLSTSSTPSIKDWRFVDLDLDGQNGAARAIDFNGGFDQVTLLRVNMHDIKSGINNSSAALDINNNHANSSYHGHTLWDQFAIFDSQITNVNNGVAYGGGIGAFISGIRHMMMGCTVDVAYGGEHCVRNPYIDRGVISHNYLARPAASKHAWTLRGPSQLVAGVAGGPGTSTKYVVARGNTLFNDVSVWTSTVSPQNTVTDERIENVLVEGNYFIGGSVCAAALVTRGPTKNLFARNNIINLTNCTNGAYGIIATGESDVPAPLSTGHIIANNTVYRTDTIGTFRSVQVGAKATDYTIVNNLAYAPLVTTANVLVGSIDSGLVTGGNSSDVQAKTSPLFSTLPSGTSLISTDVKPGGGSYAVDSGVSVSVFTDAYNAVRGATQSKGAVLP